MPPTILNLLIWSLVILTLGAAGCTYIWYERCFYLGPSKSLEYLFRSALASTIGAMILAFAGIWRFFTDRLPFHGLLLVIGILILVLNLIVTTWSFRELDDDVSKIKRGETIDHDND